MNRLTTRVLSFVCAAVLLVSQGTMSYATSDELENVQPVTETSADLMQEEANLENGGLPENTEESPTPDDVAEDTEDTVNTEEPENVTEDSGNTADVELADDSINESTEEEYSVLMSTESETETYTVTYVFDGDEAPYKTGYYWCNTKGTTNTSDYERVTQIEFEVPKGEAIGTEYQPDSNFIRNTDYHYQGGTWYTDPQRRSGYSSYLNEVIPDKDITYYAGYNETSNVITFEIGDETGSFPRINYSYSENEDPQKTMYWAVSSNTVNIASLPTASYYVYNNNPEKRFLGWFTDADCKTSIESIADNGTLTIDEDITLYAGWDTGNYLISFDPNGGFFYDHTTKTKSTEQVVIGTDGTEKTFSPGSIYNDDLHMQFQGWSTDKDAKEPDESYRAPGADSTGYVSSCYIANATFDTSTTLYAVWKSVYPVVTLKITDGSFDYYTLWGEILTVTDGEAKICASNNGKIVEWDVNEPSATADNKIFTGWKADGSSSVIAHINLSQQNIAQDTIFTANIVDAVKITYNANGGWITYIIDKEGNKIPTTIKTIKEPANSVITLVQPGNDSGEEFAGWFFDEGLTQPVSYNENKRKYKTPASGDITLYAGWGDIEIPSDTPTEFSVRVHYWYPYKTQKLSQKIKVGEKFPSISKAADSGDDIFDNKWYYYAGGEKVVISDDDRTLVDGVRYSLEDGTAYIDIYPEYIPAEYKVRYHLNNSGNDIVIEKIYQIHYAYTTPLDIEKGAVSDNSSFTDNKTSFSGWALTAKGDVAFDKSLTAEDVRSYMSSKKIKTLDLYAKWEGTEKYTLQIKAFEDEVSDEDYAKEVFSDGDYEVQSKNDLVQNDESYVNETIVLTGHEFVREGYTLSGWTYTKKVGENTTTKSLKASATIKETEKPDSAVLTAVWKPVNYTVKFNLNGGKAVAGSDFKNSFTYDKDKVREKVVLSTDVSKTGYEFAGWKEGDTEYTYYGIDSENGNIYKNLNLVAQWTPLKYDIQLNPDGGTLPGFQQNNTLTFTDVEYDGKAIELKNYLPTYDGRKFTKWALVDESGNTVKTFASNAKVKNLTTEADHPTIKLVAQWTDVSYSIKYNYDGGKLEKGVKNPSKYVVSDGATINSPVKTGYTFAGWTLTNASKDAEATISDGTGDNEGKYVLEGFGNVTLKAVWTPNKYVIKFYNNEDDAKNADQVESKVIFEGVPYSGSISGNVLGIAAQNLTKFLSEDNDFAKEVKEKYGDDASVIGFGVIGKNKIVYQLNKEYKISAMAAGLEPSDPIKLVAIWGAKTNYISYKGMQNGDKLSQNIFTFKASSKAIALPKVTRAGYKFVKWTSEADVLTEDGLKIKAGISGDIAISPDFESITYNIKVDPNGSGVKDSSGNAVKAQTINGVRYSDGKYLDDVTEKTATLPESLTRTGYTFLGFSTNKKATVAEYTSTSELKELTTKSSVTLYAIWQANAYTIDYTSSRPYVDEEESGAVTIDASKFTTSALYGVKDITLPKVTESGYTFLGWKLVDSEGAAVVESKGYVTKIKKTNTVSTVKLRPCFAENKYNIRINLNGGFCYLNGVKKTGTLTSENLKNIGVVSDAGIVEYMVDGEAPYCYKKGYNYRGVYFDSKGKKDLTTGFATLNPKNNSTVTLYAVYDKVTVPNVTGLSAKYDTASNKVNVTIGNYTDYRCVEIQYCSNFTFLYGVKTIKVYNPKKTNELNEMSGLKYYVRVRGYDYDGLGNITYGKWSSVVSASRSASE